jgi:hypothetical protein
MVPKTKFCMITSSLFEDVLTEAPSDGISDHLN